MNKLPIFLDIAADDYHAAAKRGEYLSSHLLGDFRRSPALYRRKMTGVIKERDGASLALGRATHTLILEGRAKFDAEYIASDGPINPKTGEPYGRLTKAYKEWADAQTRPIVAGDDLALMTDLQRSVWAHPFASMLLSEGVAEQTVRATYCGEPCQIRMDWFRAFFDGAPIIADLKTCCSIDTFASDARRYGYAHQLAFYRTVLAAATSGEVVADCFLIAAEKQEPRRCAVWKVSDTLLRRCETENADAIKRLRECRKTNVWLPGAEELRTLEERDIFRYEPLDNADEIDEAAANAEEGGAL